MKKKPLIYLILIGIITILLVWAFIAADNITKNIEDFGGSGSDKADIKELVITETQDGQKFWEVYAKSGHYNNNQKTAILKNIKGNFFKDKEVILSFEAPLALYSNNNKEITLKKGARAMTNQGVYIEADELKWGSHKKEIHAKGNVKIHKKPDLLVMSDESVFTIDFSYFKIIGNSKTNVYQKK